MREKELHVVGNPSAGMRSANRDAMGQGEAAVVLRRREEAPRGSGAARPPRRVKSAVGHALTFAGWFWLGYAVGLVLIVLEVAKW
jgi:hypothetical protein